MNRRAVFLDVDGTFVNDRGLVPPSARDAVTRARSRGHMLFLCVDADLVRDDINKVSFLGSDLPIDTVRAEFVGALEVIHATVPMFGPNSGEMSIPGIHKATAIELLIEHAGILREDTIGFGDGLNDLEMLRYVGVGVAMGNAHPALRDVADLVTTDADADGILLGFERLGLV